MRSAVFAINMSADGFFGHESGIADDELHEYHADVLRSAGVLFCGRVTYQMMFPYWTDVAATGSGSAAIDDFARVFSALERVVVSTTLKPEEAYGARIVRGNIEEEVCALKQKPGKNIGIGGLSVASQLMAHGLIDEYHVVVHPVVAGKGPRLFIEGQPPESMRLELLASKTLRSGAVALHYRAQT